MAMSLPKAFEIGMGDRLDSLGGSITAVAIRMRKMVASQLFDDLPAWFIIKPLKLLQGKFLCRGKL